MALALRPPRIRKWTRTDVETIARFGVFDVERARMIDPHGSPLARPIYTIPCSTWSNVVALTAEGELVLIWQYRHGSDALSLEVPGGVVDPGEAPIDAARRELREETGYEASQLEPLLVVQPNPAFHTNECHSFLARDAKLVTLPHFDDAEECEVVLVPAADLEELLDSGRITHALVVCALQAYLRVDERGRSAINPPRSAP